MELSEHLTLADVNQEAAQRPPDSAEEVSHFRHRTQSPLQRRQARRQQEHAVTNEGEAGEGEPRHVLRLACAHVESSPLRCRVVGAPIPSVGRDLDIVRHGVLALTQKTEEGTRLVNLYTPQRPPLTYPPQTPHVLQLQPINNSLNLTHPWVSNVINLIPPLTPPLPGQDVSSQI